MKKQSDLLLNADDLDTMWVCLRDNCVIDDATGAEKMNQEELPFCPSFHLYIMRTVSVPLPILTVQFYSLCTFRYHMIIAILKVSSCVQEMEAYIRGLIPNLPQLRDMPAQFVKICDGGIQVGEGRDLESGSVSEVERREVHSWWRERQGVGRGDRERMREGEGMIEGEGEAGGQGGGDERERRREGYGEMGRYRDGWCGGIGRLEWADIRRLEWLSKGKGRLE
ncbi:hypothetical protein Tco_0000059 [Tanacetum coccineum]